MYVFEIFANKRDYLPLLLLADEQEEMINRYLERGRMFVLEDHGIRSECVITDEGDGVLEIKNIATAPGSQGKGYARLLIQYLLDTFRDHFSILQVGTGDSPMTIPFYEKCGFVRSRVIPDFFTDNYDHPIFERGVQLTDMIILTRSFDQ
ncbi:MAG: GNAT family N-acetyltransferase [Clostridia bacterium]|nr:GNAT family N-acetyltransferase [Clostridia bacterium]